MIANTHTSNLHSLFYARPTVYTGWQMHKPAACIDLPYKYMQINVCTICTYTAGKRLASTNFDVRRQVNVGYQKKSSLLQIGYIPIGNDSNENWCVQVIKRSVSLKNAMEKKIGKMHIIWNVEAVKRFFFLLSTCILLIQLKSIDFSLKYLCAKWQCQ